MAGDGVLPPIGAQVSFKYALPQEDGKPAKKSSKVQGLVKFVGTVHFGDGDWIGIELDEAVGKNDGSVGDQRYFTCQPNRGVFVQPKSIISIDKVDAKASEAPQGKKATAINLSDGEDEGDGLLRGSSFMDDAEVTAEEPPKSPRSIPQKSPRGRPKSVNNRLSIETNDCSSKPAAVGSTGSRMKLSPKNSAKRLSPTNSEAFDIEDEFNADWQQPLIAARQSSFMRKMLSDDFGTGSNPVQPMMSLPRPKHKREDGGSFSLFDGTYTVVVPELEKYGQLSVVVQDGIVVFSDRQSMEMRKDMDTIRLYYLGFDTGYRCRGGLVEDKLEFEARHRKMTFTRAQGGWHSSKIGEEELAAVSAMIQEPLVTFPLRGRWHNTWTLSECCPLYSGIDVPPSKTLKERPPRRTRLKLKGRPRWLIASTPSYSQTEAEKQAEQAALIDLKEASTLFSGLQGKLAAELNRAINGDNNELLAQASRQLSLATRLSTAYEAADNMWRLLDRGMCQELQCMAREHCAGSREEAVRRVHARVTWLADLDTQIRERERIACIEKQKLITELQRIVEDARGAEKRQVHWHVMDFQRISRFSCVMVKRWSRLQFYTTTPQSTRDTEWAEMWRKWRTERSRFHSLMFTLQDANAHGVDGDLLDAAYAVCADLFPTRCSKPGCTWFGPARDLDAHEAEHVQIHMVAVREAAEARRARTQAEKEARVATLRKLMEAARIAEQDPISIGIAEHWPPPADFHRNSRLQTKGRLVIATTQYQQRCDLFWSDLWRKRRTTRTTFQELSTALQTASDIGVEDDLISDAQYCYATLVPSRCSKPGCIWEGPFKDLEAHETEHVRVHMRAVEETAKERQSRAFAEKAAMVQTIEKLVVDASGAEQDQANWCPIVDVHRHGRVKQQQVKVRTRYNGVCDKTRWSFVITPSQQRREFEGLKTWKKRYKIRSIFHRLSLALETAMSFGVEDNASLVEARFVSCNSVPTRCSKPGCAWEGTLEDLAAHEAQHVRLYLSEVEEQVKANEERRLVAWREQASYEREVVASWERWHADWEESRSKPAAIEAESKQRQAEQMKKAALLEKEPEHADLSGLTLDQNRSQAFKSRGPRATPKPKLSARPAAAKAVPAARAARSPVSPNGWRRLAEPRPDIGANSDRRFDALDRRMDHVVALLGELVGQQGGGQRMPFRPLPRSGSLAMAPQREAVTSRLQPQRQIMQAQPKRFPANAKAKISPARAKASSSTRPDVEDLRLRAQRGLLQKLDNATLASNKDIDALRLQAQDVLLSLSRLNDANETADIETLRIRAHKELLRKLSEADPTSKPDVERLMRKVGEADPTSKSDVERLRCQARDVLFSLIELDDQDLEQLRSQTQDVLFALIALDDLDGHSDIETLRIRAQTELMRKVDNTILSTDREKNVHLEDLRIRAQGALLRKVEDAGQIVSPEVEALRIRAQSELLQKLNGVYSDPRGDLEALRMQARKALLNKVDGEDPQATTSLQSAPNIDALRFQAQTEFMRKIDGANQVSGKDIEAARLEAQEALMKIIDREDEFESSMEALRLRGQAEQLPNVESADRPDLEVLRLRAQKELLRKADITTQASNTPQDLEALRRRAQAELLRRVDNPSQASNANTDLEALRRRAQAELLRRVDNPRQASNVNPDLQDLRLRARTELLQKVDNPRQASNAASDLEDLRQRAQKQLLKKAGIPGQASNAIPNLEDLRLRAQRMLLEQADRDSESIENLRLRAKKKLLQKANLDVDPLEDPRLRAQTQFMQNVGNTNPASTDELEYHRLLAQDILLQIADEVNTENIETLRLRAQAKLLQIADDPDIDDLEALRLRAQAKLLELGDDSDSEDLEMLRLRAQKSLLKIADDQGTDDLENIRLQAQAKLLKMADAPGTDDIEYIRLRAQESLLKIADEPDDMPFVFDARLLSKNVTISQDCTSARHARRNDEMRGVVFGSSPIPRDGEGVRYFEIQIDGTREGMDDGLAIGVTTSLPNSYEDFDVAIDVPNSWTIGYDGGCQSPNDEDMIKTDWCPKDLKIGDRVGLRVSAEGEVEVFENGEKVAEIPARVPEGVHLYGLVDLLGNTNAVSLVANASTPSSYSF